FLEKFDEILCGAAADEAGFDAVFPHHAAQIIDESKGNATGSGLERESVFHDARFAQEAGDELGNAQAVGRARELGGAGDDFRGIADRVDFDDVVDIVALNLPGDAGEWHEIIGDDDYVVGIDGVGQGEAEGAAGGLTVGAVSVAKWIGRGRGNDGNVNMHFA